jgi:hypothetical protein
MEVSACKRMAFFGSAQVNEVLRGVRLLVGEQLENQIADWFASLADLQEYLWVASSERSFAKREHHFY